jgi:hypothetical protein
MTFASGISWPWKSGVRTSTLQPGAWRRICRMTPTKAEAPLSGRSSRSTEVMTAWRRPSWPPTGRRGRLERVVPRRLAVWTLQKPQRRVHVSPRIMNVAVPRVQHSPMFGHAASEQTVWRFSSLIILESSTYFAPPAPGP